MGIGMTTKTIFSPNLFFEIFPMTALAEFQSFLFGVQPMILFPSSKVGIELMALMTRDF